eukprot:TRINITY_DN27661_c0_g1_i1.p1 TRINITY_DN27661_c0_g1~~TRINITY_DN27661_c0_g1_i1.p1  ORF type:complete len:469 (-),score=33.96 TRINITY_DN27661_c0_g1_i1:215-1621(-)
MLRRICRRLCVSPLIANVSNNRKTVNVQWTDNLSASFHALWLWDNNPSHKEPDSQQRMFAPGDTPLDTTVETATLSPNGLQLVFSDGKQAHFDSQWLKEHNNAHITTTAPAVGTFNAHKNGNWWQNISSSDLAVLSYTDLNSHPDCLKHRARFLAGLNRSGLALLREVPVQYEKVLDVAEQFLGPPMRHLYGLMFEVKAEENPINIAYTNLGLSAHQDLNYYESPPGIQLLHCHRFDPQLQGGETFVVDGLIAAEVLRKEQPEHFNTLTRIPATFQKKHLKRDNPSWRIYRRPHFQLNPSGDLINVSYSPPFEGPLQACLEDMEPYYAAVQAYKEVVERHMATGFHSWSVRLQPGDCLVFNNRRMLHGRRSFDGKGQRLFQGAYVNIDEYLNTVQLAQLQFPDVIGDVIYRAGNNNWTADLHRNQPTAQPTSGCKCQQTEQQYTVEYAMSTKGWKPASSQQQTASQSA